MSSHGIIAELVYHYKYSAEEQGVAALIFCNGLQKQIIEGEPVYRTKTLLGNRQHQRIIMWILCQEFIFFFFPFLIYAVALRDARTVKSFSDSRAQIAWAGVGLSVSQANPARRKMCPVFERSAVLSSLMPT